MRSTIGALDLGAAHAVAGIVDHFEIFLVDGRVEAGPSAAGFEFGSGAEQLRIAAYAVIRSVVVQIPIFAGERRFGAALARDFVLFRRELFFPLFVSLHAFSLHWKLAESDPIRLFKKWFDAAVRAELKEPNAMTLATASREGKPSARMVLLTGVDAPGFVFYTNYKSRH